MVKSFVVDGHDAVKNMRVLWKECGFSSENIPALFDKKGTLLISAHQKCELFASQWFGGSWKQKIWKFQRAQNFQTLKLHLKVSGFSATTRNTLQ